MTDSTRDRTHDDDRDETDDQRTDGNATLRERAFEVLSRREFMGDTATVGGAFALASGTATAGGTEGSNDGGANDGDDDGEEDDAGDEDDANGANGDRPIQAPALPGAPTMSRTDRVYTADQSSNTVSVIDPAANDGDGAVLGTIPLGERRLDGVLGPVDTNQVNVHGLGFSRDGKYVDAVSVTSNAAQVIDTGSNEVVETAYVGRSPHEGFISPDGSEVWVAVRGEDYVAVIDRGENEVVDRIETADGASKVVFSPDGERAYVNHVRETVLVVVDVASREVAERIDVPDEAGPSADLAASPDGEEVWLGHPIEGYATVVDATDLSVKASFETGPRTNHPNFVTFEDAAYTYLTVGGENATKVFARESSYDGEPELVETIAHNGVAPHGVWPSPDNSRAFVALQKSDAVDVIDTESREIVNTLRVGQGPQALIYVARAPDESDEDGESEAAGNDEDGESDGGDSSTDGASVLTDQGLGERITNFDLDVSAIDAADASGLASVRDMGDLDEIDVTARGLPAETAFTVRASDGETETALFEITSNEAGTVGEALAFVQFFVNGYEEVSLVPIEEEPSATISFFEQRSDGESVRVAATTLSEGGYVAIHDDSLLDGDPVGSVIGVSTYLESGTHTGVDVELFDVEGATFDASSLDDDGTLIAMPHRETNGNETYEFVATGGEADGPYTRDGEAVVDPAEMTIEND